MKSILLFRHGKSDWKANYGKDHDRPLSLRGVKAAKVMGTYLFKIQQIPDLIISSTALRAKKTAQIAKKFGQWNSDFILDKNIYHCSEDKLLMILSQQDPSIHFICIVGHQPIFSHFLSKTTDLNWVKLPTASMARIDFPFKTWEELKFGKGVLSWMKKPKELMSFKTSI
ncbi:MAG: SixA phosphatase family protein [Candidatus Neomarinimicrobiota bacterium]